MLHFAVGIQDMFSQPWPAPSNMFTKRAFISLRSRMFICDVAIQRVDVFEHFTALRTFNLVLCLAMKRSLVNHQLIRAFESFATALRSLVLRPFSCICFELHWILPTHTTKRKLI